MPEDIVRVLRIYEFVGPRSAIEKQIEKSIHGPKTIQTLISGGNITIRGATIGFYPEIMETPDA